jgi:hypothetical protein
MNATIKRLSLLCDLIGLATYIGETTEWGETGGETWEHTRAFLAEYAPKTNADDVIALLEQAGAHSDIQAAVWIAENEPDVP